MPRCSRKGRCIERPFLLFRVLLDLCFAGLAAIASLDLKLCILGSEIHAGKITCMKYDLVFHRQLLTKDSVSYENYYTRLSMLIAFFRICKTA